MGLNSVGVTDFSGGLNTRDNPRELKDNEARDLINVAIHNKGYITGRGGITQFDTAGFPAAKRAQHIRQWRRKTAALTYDTVLMASIDGDIYSFDTGGVGTLIQAGTSATNVYYMEQMQDNAGADFLWCVDGVTPYKINSALVPAAWASVPQKVTMLRSWRNFMVAAGSDDFPRRLYFSNLANPDVWTVATDFVDVISSEDDLDPIVWIEIVADDLLVFKQKSVWRVTAPPPNVALKRIGQVGCSGRFQTAELDNRAYTWQKDGLWSIDARTFEGVIPLRFESGRIDNWIKQNLDYGQVHRIRVCAWDRRIFIAIPTDNTFQGNSTILEYVPYMITEEEEGVGAWTIHEMFASSLAKLTTNSQIDWLYGGASNEAKLYKLLDPGSAETFNWWWTTGWRSESTDEKLERLRRVNIVNLGEFTIEVFRDFSDALVDSGTMTFIGPNRQMSRFRPESRARHHSLRFSAVGSTPELLSFELVYRGPREH